MSATPPGSPGARAASREAKPEGSLLPYLIRRPATLRSVAHMGRMGGFTGSLTY